MLDLYLLLSFMSWLACSVAIPCEFVSKTWEPNNKYKLNSRQIIVSTRYGFDMIVDSEDLTVSKSIMEKGYWNSSQIHIIALFLKPNMNVLNLGSQSGLEAILMGKLIGPQGKLFIFEPYSPSYSIVKKNIYFNDLETKSRIYKVGASDSQGQSKMLIFSENTGAASIYSFAGFPTTLSGRSYEEQIVRVDKVDNVLPTSIKIDFALIDVEKMQVEALLGMRKTIEKSVNLVMIVQWEYKVNSHRNEQKTMRCLEWLTKQGFKFYKYKQNVDNKCQIGSFELIKDPFSLLQEDPLDLLIAPSHVNPNNLK